MGWVGNWGGAGLVGLGGWVDWSSGAWGAEWDCNFRGSDWGECGLCAKGVVVGGVGGVCGGVGGESGGGVTVEGAGDKGGGGGAIIFGGVGDLGLKRETG